MVFNYTILKILKVIATHPMMQVSQQQWLQYGSFKSIDMGDGLRIGGHLLRELYNTVHVTP